MITLKDSTTITLVTKINGKGILNVRSESPIRHITLRIDGVGTFSGEANGTEASLPFTVENPRLWSVNSPNLYTYTVTLDKENGVEEASGTFGIRELSTNGKEICLNGTPVYVRGYIRGTTAHDHQNNGKLSTEDFYRKNIRQAKKFGFNFVRFHSVVPDETFFKVADEEGMLVHIELRPPHDIYNNLEEMVTTGTAIVPEEFLQDVVNRLYNHPSLTVYCIGNEIKNLGGTDAVGEIYRRLKALDDTRLFLDTCAWGENGRPYVDMDVQHLSYYFPFGSHAAMYEDTDNLLVVGNSGDRPLKTEGENSSVLRTLDFKVPLMAHEVCHYTALRDFKALKEKFVSHGTPCPWWIDEELKMIEAKGFSVEYDEMYKASKHFQRECWKTAYEAMRTSKLLGGFHFLQFADTDVYENSNGVVDCFDDDCYIKAEDFLRFNGDIVLAAKVGNRLFASGDNVSFPVYVSNCGEDKEPFADFSYTLIGESGKTYAQGDMKNINVSKKGLFQICKLNVRMPEIDSSEELILTLRLTVNGTLYTENSWKLWVYAKRPALSYQDFVSIDGDYVVTDDIEKAFTRLSEGKKVCLVYRQNWTRHLLDKQMVAPRYAFKATWNRFKPVIWDRGTNYGGICEDALLKKHGFTSGRFYDFNYNVISEDCDKIVLDDFPCPVKNLISGIDKSCRDRFDAYKGSFNLPELMYDRTLRRFGYLFELKVGEGSLLVCGLNMTGLDRSEPSTAAMASFIQSYLASADFAPATGVSVEALKAYMTECAKKPVKERMMTQFWQYDDTPVESKQYWIDSRAYLTEKE